MQHVTIQISIQYLMIYIIEIQNERSGRENRSSQIAYICGTYLYARFNDIQLACYSLQFEPALAEPNGLAGRRLNQFQDRTPGICVTIVLNDIC